MKKKPKSYMSVVNDIKKQRIESRQQKKDNSFNTADSTH